MSICQDTILQSLQYEYFDLHKFNSIKDAEKVFLRYGPYSEQVVCCPYKVYNYLLDKIKRICFLFQIWTCMKPRHELHEGNKVCHKLNVKRDR